MKETFKYLLSEYRLELGALALGCLILLGTGAAICLPDTQLLKALPGIALIIGIAASIIGLIIGFTMLLGKASPERKQKILKSSVTVGRIIIAIILSPILVPLGLYFLPSIIAWKRKHRNLLAIFILNLCLSPVMGVGWVVALVWAFLKQEAPVVVQSVPQNVIPL